MPQLPTDIFLKIMHGMVPSDIHALGSTTKETAELLKDQHLWRKKCERHFPHACNKLSDSKEINWHAEYKKNYQKEYARLSPVARQLFSLVKEGDVRRLCKLTLKLSDFDLKDSEGRSLIDWALTRNDQFMLDYFYSVIRPWYMQIPDVNLVDKRGYKRTALYWALTCRQPADEIVSLLQQGSQVDEVYFPEHSSTYPIKIAALHGQLDVVKQLVARKSSLIHQGNPLTIAATHGHFHIVEYLLSQNADVNGPSMINSPIRAALLHNQDDIVILLLENNASINSAGIWLDLYVNLFNVLIKKRRIDWACQLLTQNPTLLPDLIRYKYIIQIMNDIIKYQRNDFLEWMLEKDPRLLQKISILAVEAGSVPIIELCIRKGVQLDNLLAVVLEKRRRDIYDILLNAGADIRQAIHTAAKQGYGDIVHDALEQDPSLLNAPDQLNQTPLLWAAASGHLEIVKDLYRRGASLTVATRHPAQRTPYCGNTALHWAVDRGHRNVVHFLIQHLPKDQLDRVTDVAHYTPLALAYLNKQMTIVNDLISAGAKRSSVINHAAQIGDLPFIQTVLLEEPILLEHVDDRCHQTPLMWAACLGHKNVVTFFVETRCNIISCYR